MPILGVSRNNLHPCENSFENNCLCVATPVKLRLCVMALNKRRQFRLAAVCACAIRSAQARCLQLPRGQPHLAGWGSPHLRPGDAARRRPPLGLGVALPLPTAPLGEAGVAVSPTEDTSSRTLEMEKKWDVEGGQSFFSLLLDGALRAQSLALLSEGGIGLDIYV